VPDFILSCESTIDLDPSTIDEYSLHYVPFHFTLGNKEYEDDLGKTIPYDEFYKRMSQGEITHTSQVSVGEYINYFEPFLREGKDILHLSLSTGLSGTFNSAMTAKNLLQDKYPERRIEVLDSLAASSGYGLLMVTLAEKKKAGAGLDELKTFVLEHRLELHHEFFSTDLKYYVRGGRISKTAGFFGTVFRICPLLDMNDKGQLTPREKCITVKMAQKAMLKKMASCVQDGPDYAGRVFLCQSSCLSFAKPVAEAVEAAYPKMVKPARIFPIGTTIGSHTGPGTVALFYWGSKRTA